MKDGLLEEDQVVLRRSFVMNGASVEVTLTQEMIDVLKTRLSVDELSDNNIRDFFVGALSSAKEKL